MKGKPLFFFLSVLLLGACGKSDFYSQDVTIEGQEWEAKKQVDFEVDVKDTTAFYDFFIDFRHNDNYPYSEIYFIFGIDFPNGKSSNDTIHYTMQGSDGKWFGKRSGTIFDNHVLVRPKTAFPVKGKYKMHLKHLMRDERLPGIEDVGICITPKD